jgi:predicted nucleic acid-binding Zn ribbon protein
VQCVSDRDEPKSKRGWKPLPTYSTAPTPLRSALDNLASTLGLTDVDSINALFVDWPEIVGEHLAQHCKPRALRDQVLTIEASDHQWATELKWMTSLLIERCCDALGEGAVTDVRIIR